jgi:N-acetylglucosaminyl-diphospho-decaprenol L-rhamnosyltransferase
MLTNTTIIIVSFNSREMTLRALAAAGEATAGLDAVRVLADNGSTDGTPDAVLSALPGVEVVVYADNPGYGAALNRAFSAFPGFYLCALNGDVLLAPGSLQILRQFMDDHPKCGLVGPSLMSSDGRPQSSCKRFPTLGFAVAELFAIHGLFPRNRWVRWFYYKGQDLTVPTFVQTVSGAAMLIRGDAFRRIGGFDHGFRMYFEETDLCWRLRESGYHIAYHPQATAIHWHGASTIQTSVRQVEYYLSYVRFFSKHHGPGSARILAAAVAASTALRMLALPIKYPPLSRRGRAVLAPKLSACCGLLGDLPRSAALRTPMQVRP